MNTIMDEIPSLLVQKFDELFSRIERDSGTFMTPVGPYLRAKIMNSSFKDFSHPDIYRSNRRAEPFLEYVSPRWGDRAFRVYYNPVSRKVYIDLNHHFIAELRNSVDAEMNVLCDLMRSILFANPVDPNARNTVVALTKT